MLKRALITAGLVLIIAGLMGLLMTWPLDIIVTIITGITKIPPMFMPSTVPLSFIASGILLLLLGVFIKENNIYEVY